MRRNLVLHAALLGVLAVAPVAAASGGQQVDPRSMERAARVSNPGPVDGRIVGAWEVWIPGSVFYTTDGLRVAQHYQPGAAMNRLEIASDGRYRWGDKQGRLEEVRPWHAQANRRYFRVVNAGGNEYEFYYGTGDKLVVLFGGVGGHAATGTRLGGSAAASSTPSPTATTRDAARGGYAAGARVEIAWSGGWYPGKILRAENGRYLVSYDGYGSNWDEWVDASRLRGGDNAGAAAGGNAGPPATGQGGTTTTGNNPLGVEWVTGPPPLANGLADALVDRWRYIAASFHGNGRVDNALDVGGTLEFEANGEYVQSLSIGGICNNLTGTWRIVGDRVVTSYAWRGRTASDEMTVHLRADGKQLTLVTQGSPQAYYTLERVE